MRLIGLRLRLRADDVRHARQRKQVAQLSGVEHPLRLETHELITIEGVGQRGTDASAADVEIDDLGALEDADALAAAADHVADRHAPKPRLKAERRDKTGAGVEVLQIRNLGLPVVACAGVVADPAPQFLVAARTAGDLDEAVLVQSGNAQQLAANLLGLFDQADGMAALGGAQRARNAAGARSSHKHFAAHHARRSRGLDLSHPLLRVAFDAHALHIEDLIPLRRRRNRPHSEQEENIENRAERKSHELAIIAIPGEESIFYIQVHTSNRPLQQDNRALKRYTL